MNETVRKDILAAITGAIRILATKEESDFSELKELSNSTIHNASIFQDHDSISVAVIIYSISKIFERTGEVDRKVITHLKEMQRFLTEGYDHNFHRAIRNTMQHITMLDRKVGLYIEQVVQQARIKKGSKIYEHGISLARAADLLGISQWQLMDYIGKTTIQESTPPQMEDVKKRLDYARGLFR
jgi:hypothetical protein